MSGVTDCLQTVTDRHGQATDTLWTQHGHTTYVRTSITDALQTKSITDALRTLRTHYGHMPDSSRTARYGQGTDALRTQYGQGADAWRTRYGHDGHSTDTLRTCYGRQKRFFL